MKLVYPNMREELVDYLDQLAHPRVCRPPKTTPDPLEYAIHFLFDDTCLWHEPRGAVGYFLNDEEEVDIVSRVVAALDELLNVHGTQRTDDFYLKQPEWQTVASTSAEAYELLRRKD